LRNGADALASIRNSTHPISLQFRPLISGDVERLELVRA
jgi:hypothetical protein